MKTYIISTSPLGNAIPNYFFALAYELHAQGNTVIVITDRNKPQLLPPNREKLFFYSWPSRRPTNLRDFSFFYKLCRLHKPDVCLGQFGSTNVVALVSKVCGVRNIFVYWHTMFDQLSIDGRKSSISTAIKHLLKNNILKACCTGIFTNSEESRKDIHSHYGIPLHRIHIFHYLIPDFFAGKAIPSRNERGYSIAFIARLDRSKGHAFVLREMPALIQAFPGLKMYIVGEGGEKDELIKLNRELGLQDSVIFTGAVPLEEVYRYMSGSLAHVSASEQEAFGLVNAEALSAGTPILAQKVGGIKEILDDGRNGYFFSNKIPGDFTARATLLLQGEWEQFSAEARRSFIEKFSASDENIKGQLRRLEKIIG